MDAIFNGFANLGIGGLMAGAVVYIHLHVVRKVIPEMLQTFKSEIAAEREQHDRHITLLADRITRVEDRLDGHFNRS